MSELIKISFFEKREEIDQNELKKIIIDKVKRVSAGIQRMKEINWESEGSAMVFDKWIRNTHYKLEIRLNEQSKKTDSLVLWYNNYDENEIIRKFQLGFVKDNGTLIYGFVINNNVVVKIYHQDVEKFFDVSVRELKLDTLAIKDLVRKLPGFTEKLLELPIKIE